MRRGEEKRHTHTHTHTHRVREREKERARPKEKKGETANLAFFGSEYPSTTLSRGQISREKWIDILITRTQRAAQTNLDQSFQFPRKPSVHILSSHKRKTRSKACQHTVYLIYK